MSILSRRLRTSFASLVALPLLATGCGGSTYSITSQAKSNWSG